MNQAATQRRQAGIWTVIIIMLLGVLAGLVAVYMWSTYGKPRPNPASIRERAFRSLAERVDRAINRGKPRTVIGDVEEFIKTYPMEAGGYRLLGQVHIKIGKLSDEPTPHYQRAYEALSLSLQRDPRAAAIHHLAGDLALELGNYKAAEDHFRKATELKPQELAYRVRLAVAFAEQEDLTKARQILGKVMMADATQHQAYYAMGDVYAREGKWETALGFIDQAIKKLQNHPPASGDSRPLEVKYIRKRAQLLLRMDKPTQALNALLPPTGLTTVELSDPEVLKTLAYCYSMRDEPAKAAAVYETQLKFRPDHWPLVAEAAFWHIKAGNLEKAAERLQHLRGLVPKQNDPTLLERRIEVLQSDYRRAEAQDARSRATESE